MHFQEYAAIALIGSLASATPISSSPPEKRAFTQFSYAALGDSFGAGIGAGTLLSEDNSADGRNNICARMSKSYPEITKTFLSQRVTSYEFLACSGDVLNDIDGQVSTLLGHQPNAISLSISGNDFGFGKVVAFCVYPYRGMKDQAPDAQQGCNDKLNEAEGAIGDEAIWEKYRSKISLIRQSLAENGHIYITGYARFFSPGGSSDDQCHKNHFFNSSLGRFISLLNMRWETRSWMNDLVAEANRRIQVDVVQRLGGDDAKIHFIDIDGQFNGRRFCEPGKNPWGARDEDVWFHDLFSDMEEQGTWQGPAHPDELLGVAPGTPEGIDPPPGSDDDGDGLKSRGMSDKFQQSSVFHPKKYAHELTAHILTYRILQNTFPDEEVVSGPNQICMGFSPGGGETCFDVPAGCAALDPVDNTSPGIYCEDGRIIQ